MDKKSKRTSNGSSSSSAGHPHSARHRPRELAVAESPAEMMPVCASARPSSDEENVHVVVRVRPMSKSEIEKGFVDIIDVNSQENRLVIQNPLTESLKPFRFDGVFSTESTQAEVFNQVARPIIDNVIHGYNGTIFAYGQTGTGKTFTMEGDRSVPELKGIIPNSFAQIFSHIAKESEHSKFLVHVSYLEIYNEDVRDLLGKDSSKKLEVKERPDTGVYVKNLSAFVVRSEADMERVLKIGNKNRVVGSTNMNNKSSRSHAIFSINVECSTEIGGERSLRMGKLNLVDLAGSERISKTGATGQRLKEGAKINLSLSCLGNVIAALVEGQAHVPYRSSKLTRLLQDSLGGNSKTVMIANVGPADDNYEESISTLRYADRAKQITNRAHVNEDPKDAMLRQFEKEIEELRKKLEQGDFVEMGDSSEKVEDDEDDADDVSLLVPDEDTLMGIRGEIESNQRLSSVVQSEAESKKTALNALKENVLTWKQQQEKKAHLEEKLKSLQNKIMIGGENLLDKSQEQEAYLQKSMVELEERRKAQLKLQDSLTSKMAEKAELEAYVLRQQESLREKKREIRKLSRILKKERLEDQAAMEEEAAEMAALESELQRVQGQTARIDALIDEFIPPEHLKLIKKNMKYNEETQQWDVNSVAYTGNHVTHSVPYLPPPRDRRKRMDISFMYFKGPGLKFREDGDDYVNCTPRRTSEVLSREFRLKLVEDHCRENDPNYQKEQNAESSEEEELEETPVIDMRE